MPGWNSSKAQLGEELLRQAREEGKDPKAIAAIHEAFRRTDGDDAACASAFAELLALPLRSDFPYYEPDDLEDIRRARPSRRPSPLPVLVDDDAVLLDRIHGAWLGRCVGCALGKPVEGHGLRGYEAVGVGAAGLSSAKEARSLRPWARIKEYLTAISPDEWPIRDYVPISSPADADPAIGKTWCPASTREHIAFMESDDDIRYTVLGLELLREKGLDFTTWDVALGWINRLTYRAVCTAEIQAFLNLISRYEFHAGSDWGRRVPDVDWHWVATHNNPYREWIGAQIRVDAYAYAAAGNPELAAELAWRDARLSHRKNGIYGAMLCAAMIAAAFGTEDVRAVVNAGLAEIPENCRLAEAVHETIAIVEKHGSNPVNFEQVIGDVHLAFEHYSTVHTITNAAICVAAVLLSGGDFHHGVSIAVMGGWDTDCNGATVGSIVGAMTGAQSAPRHWISCLNDTLRSEIPDYHPIAISECARRTFEVALIARNHFGPSRAGDTAKA